MARAVGPIRRALLIVNPAARSATARLDWAKRTFAECGVTIDVRETERPGHAAELARAHSAGCDAVFTLGGDGTAIEVIGALAESGPPVGILPGGTGNVVAQSLGIPLKVSEAVPALVNGQETRVDLGRLGNGARFIIGIGVGVDAEMIAGASHGLKKRLGFLAYFVSGIRSGIKLTRFRYRITVDGATHEGEAVSVLVANLGSLLGGLVTLGKQIRHDDGVLHVCVFAPTNLARAIMTFGRMLTGKTLEDGTITYIAGRSIQIETTPTRRAQADGEMMGDTPLDIVVEPGAARLLTPR